jgi:hypothetical protein
MIYRKNGLSWRKAQRSVGNGECVEVSSAVGYVAVRDSTNLDGGVLLYKPVGWRISLKRTKEHDFDLGS